MPGEQVLPVMKPSPRYCSTVPLLTQGEPQPPALLQCKLTRTDAMLASAPKGPNRTVIVVFCPTTSPRAGFGVAVICPPHWALAVEALIITAIAAKAAPTVANRFELLHRHT